MGDHVRCLSADAPKLKECGQLRSGQLQDRLLGCSEVLFLQLLSFQTLVAFIDRH